MSTPNDNPTDMLLGMIGAIAISTDFCGTMHKQELALHAIGRDDLAEMMKKAHQIIHDIISALLDDEEGSYPVAEDDHEYMSNEKLRDMRASFEQAIQKEKEEGF